MTLQEILFIVAVVFFALAAISIITAVVVFFVRNIPDVQADLSGKKRAVGVAEMAAQRPGRDRRKGVARVEPTSGTLDSGRLSGQLHDSSPLDNPLNQVPHVESVVSQAASAPVVSQPSQSFQPQPSYQVSPVAEKESDDSETTILPDDDQSTTILPTEEERAAAAAPEPEISAPEEEPAAAPAAATAPDALASTTAPDVSAATTVPVETVGAASCRPAPEPAASDGHAPIADDSATTILPTEDAAATILPGDDSATTILPTEAAPATPEGFVIVRKIVLRESESVITAG